LPNWGGNIDGDEWLLLSRNGALRLNIATLKSELFWRVEPADSCPLGSAYEFNAPIAVVGNWLWDTNLRRAKLDASRFEQLPYVRAIAVPSDQPISVDTMLSIHEGKDLLFADNCGMWIAAMKEQ
jgi:hypothetical protein